MTTSFSEIPKGRREPGAYVEIDPSLAVRGLQGMPHKTLIIGQFLASGTAAAGELRLITDPEQAAVAWGRGSMLHKMCLTYRQANETTEMWGVGVADGVGAATAIKSLTVSKIDAGEDFGSGTLSAYVGGRLVQVGVSASDTPAEVGDRLKKAAELDHLLIARPKIFGVGLPANAQTHFEARHGGATVGAFDVRVNYRDDEVLPTNMAITITTETAGATDPVVAPALLAAEGDWWTEVVLPYTDGTNIAAVDEWLKDRFDALDMRDGGAYAVEAGTVTELFTAGQTRNSPFISLLPSQNSPTPTFEMAASYAGIAAFQFQIDPARQLKSLELPGALAPAVEDRFTPNEMDLLLNNGVSSVRVEGGKLRLWRCITTYRESGTGALDTSYMDLTTMTTLAYIRWAEVQRMLLRFPRHKLANNGTRFSQGQAIATPEIIGNELVGFFSELEDAGLVENMQGFIDGLIVERDSGDPNRLNSLQTPDLINNFRIFAAKIQFRL